MGNFRNRVRPFGGKRDKTNNSLVESNGRRLRPAFLERRAKALADDSRMSVHPLEPGGKPRIGWLYNMVAATVEEPSTKRPVQAVDLFFIPEDGGSDFRATVVSRPYMLVAVSRSGARDAELALRRHFSDFLAEIYHVELEDTSEPNHLALEQNRPFLKVETRTSFELNHIKTELEYFVARNADRRKRSAAVNPDLAGSCSTYAAGVKNTGDVHFFDGPTGSELDGLELVEDVREYDVAPVNRFAIDNKVNVGYWYTVYPGGFEGDSPDIPDVSNERGPTSCIGADISDNAANSFTSARLKKLEDIVDRANPIVLAYDIECTKAPLRFPDADAGDQVMMISWMVDGKGYLGINREVVSSDIDDFEYSPHDYYRGDFQVYNEPDENALLRRFFLEVRLAAPRVFVTYNGDFFDWPFVEKRAQHLGISMQDEIGMSSIQSQGVASQTHGRTAIHMDVFHWVNRDSYLPQGSRGLKAVTRTLLGFEPEEIPPEEMMTAAKERPHEMARYSVSDAVCTYHLYMKYVHPFIFSLCNIIPLNPDDVLRKGSGTLCEMLLMCQAHEKKIVAPNKHNGTAIGKLTRDGHVLETETYIGGHVEALRTGVYRSDLPASFNIDVSALDDLESSLDDTLKFAITVEAGSTLEEVSNYDDIRRSILCSLRALRERPVRDENPLIYHLDVSAMYPNIILTNRLQPHAIVTPVQCAACDFNGSSECQRLMEWTWRGEYFPASRGEAEMIQRRVAQEERDAAFRASKNDVKADGVEPVDETDDNQLLERKFVPARSGYRTARHAGSRKDDSIQSNPGQNNIQRSRTPSTKNHVHQSSASSLPSFEDESVRKHSNFRQRLKDYCRTNYRRGLDTKVESRQATVCQRENPFYVDTVRAFRDRRYEYKSLLKRQKKALEEAKKDGNIAKIAETERKIVLYDSLQLAHKCILNSFYGYVMRRGARWYSMEMAGVVTNTGALIIRRAREFIERVGLPLELDTDGIWCMLPVSFPENFTFTTKNGKTHTFNFICSVFNADVASNFANHQYQDLVNSETLEYETRSECSILFEVDGPYRAMVLPASLEEGKSIKKRYAVFNDNGSLAELKGFEIKRRGELKLIKEFQGQIFQKFLEGSTLKECYSSVGATCNKWLQVLVSRGEGMTDSEVLDLLAEQNNMSKPLDEYILLGQKSLAITCATRMKAFLGDAVAANGGLATTYVVSSQPDNLQITERAIPAKIFELDNVTLRSSLLRKWTQSADEGDLSLRNLIDWEYYKGRLANAVLKIVSIPAALQAVDNPVPEIEYPAWLMKRCRDLQDQRKQKTLSSFFAKLPRGEMPDLIGRKPLQDVVNDTAKLDVLDIEDMPLVEWTETKRSMRRHAAAIVRRRREQHAQRRNGQGRPDSVLDVACRASDPVTRAREMRSALKALLDAPHPDKREDYEGWLEHAKKVWRAQRSIRVRRYTTKRDRERTIIDQEQNYEDIWPRQRKSDAIGDMRHDSKRRKLQDCSDQDYAPKNFIADNAQTTSVRPFYFQERTVPLLAHGVLWHVISISTQPNAHGEFRLWVLPTLRDGEGLRHGDMHCIRLHVNRVLHFKSRESAPRIANASIERSAVILPRSRPAKDVYRVEVSEKRFLAKDKELSNAIHDALGVDAVFGTKSPLLYDAILDVGALCAPKPLRAAGSKLTYQNVMSNGISSDDIIPKDASSYPYLGISDEMHSRNLLHQAFLYGSHAADGTSRALYALIAPAVKRVLVVIVTSAKRPPKINLSSIWTKVHDTSHEDSCISDTAAEHSTGVIPANSVPPSVEERLPQDLEFELITARSRSEAYALLNRALSRLRDDRVTSTTRDVGRRMLLLTQWPDACRVFDQAFSTQRDQIIETSHHVSRLENDDLEICLPAVTAYPVVRIVSNADDGRYQPVGWESSAVLLALTRFTEVSNWLPAQVAICRFAGIPVGNVSMTDIHAQALDVLMGRELKNNDHVLWTSDHGRPDLGGAEEEENHVSEEPVPIPEFTNPGSYRTVCIDTELTDLAVAAILASSHVNQLEGTDLAFDAAANPSAKARPPRADLQKKYDDSAAQDDGRDEPRASPCAEGEIGSTNVAPLDELAGSAPAFRTLKGLVAQWEQISVENNNSNAEFAKELLEHVYRWIGSESSLLYDPALSRFLAWLIHKIFWQLLSELRGLGAGIVYASASRLILVTPKVNAIDALRYAGFLERTVKSKPLFKHVKFEPIIAINAGMVFVDRFNYGAVPCFEEKAILSGELHGDLITTSRSRRTYGNQDIPNARMFWDIARYLPVPVAVLLSQVIEEFLRRPVINRLRCEDQQHMCHGKCKKDMQLSKAMDVGNSEAARTTEGCADPETTSKNRVCTCKIAESRRAKLNPRGDGYADEVRSFVQDMTSELLGKIQEIREKAPVLHFPEIPSTFEVDLRRDAALEFVRTVCYIMSLDNAAVEVVANLRRSLLRFLGVPEFAKEAQFQDPSISMVLRNIICSFCNAVVDLDLARDARLWDSASQDVLRDTHSPPATFSCEHCSHPYDMDAIELALVRDAQRLITSYQVQDLKCNKCRLVKRDNMSQHCGCSGSNYELIVGPRMLHKSLRAFRNVARFHEFTLLAQTVEWMMSSCGNVAA